MGPDRAAFGSNDASAMAGAAHSCDRGLASASSIEPQVTRRTADKDGRLEAPLLANTWNRDARGEFPCAVVEAMDGPQVGIDPLTYLYSLD